MSIKLRLTIIISIAIFLISSLAAVMIGHTIKNKKRVDFVKAAFDSMIALDDVKKIISRQNIELADYLISAKQQDIAEFKAFTLQTEKEINKWNNAIERSLQTGLLNEDGNNKHAESLERNYTLAVDSSLKVMALSEAGNNKQAKSSCRSKVPSKDRRGNLY